MKNPVSIFSSQIQLPKFGQSDFLAPHTSQKSANLAPHEAHPGPFSHTSEILLLYLSDPHRICPNLHLSVHIESAQNPLSAPRFPPIFSLYLLLLCLKLKYLVSRLRSASMSYASVHYKVCCCVYEYDKLQFLINKFPQPTSTLFLAL